MDVITKFFRWLTNQPKKKDRILTPIDESELNWNKEKKELLKYVRSLEAQISKVQAKKREDHVDEFNRGEELDLIFELQKRKQEIDSSDYKDPYDLAKLFRALMKKKKFKKKFEIVDKDDSVVFDKFNTILILKNGKLAIQGKSGEIWSEGNNIREVIWKPDSIANQIRRGRILMPYDKDGNYIIDLENLEMSEMSYDSEEGKWNISEENEKKVKQIIIERDNLINNLRKDKEGHEETINKLRDKNRDLELSLRSWKTQGENAQTQLSIALQNEQQAMSKIGQLSRDLTDAKEDSTMNSMLKEKYDKAFDELGKELEDDKSQTKLKRAKLEIWKEIERAKKYVPKEKEIIHEKEEIKPPIQVGR